MTNIIRELRDLVPLRPLSVAEAMRVAELQANRFLKLSRIDQAPFPEYAISELPRIHVERMTPAPVSGAAQWSRGRWLIILNGAETTGRQRYSLGHEFKHILDANFIAYLYPAIRNLSAHDRGEQICDYFAACLLMPRAWIKSAFYNDGVQDVGRLARRFEVSIAAMSVRLQQLGLVEPVPRCGVAVKSMVAA